MTDRKQALTEFRYMVQRGEFPADLTGKEMGFPNVSAANLYAVFAGSLDAAKALHEAVLPGWSFAVASHSPRATLHPPKFNLPHIKAVHAEAANPARAWLSAIIEALIAGEERAKQEQNG